MTRPSDALSQAPNLKNLGGAFRLVGWISLWIKLVLVVISSVLVLFAFFSEFGDSSQASNSLSGLGLLFTVGGILTLGLSVFWSFRYIRRGRSFLSSTKDALPSKATTLTLIKTVLLTDLAGTLVTFIAVQSSVGISIGKALSRGAMTFNQYPSQIVEPIDLFVIQACINIIAGLFAGIVASLWLLQRTTQQRPSR